MTLFLRIRTRILLESTIIKFWKFNMAYYVKQSVAEILFLVEHRIN